MPVAEQIVLYSGTGRPRCAAAGARVRRHSSRRVDPAGRRHRRPAPPGICPRSSTVKSGFRGSPNRRPGSDLASLRTTARKDGDGYVVNGQKLWASGGMHADWCLLLARTDPEAPKRKGISYFLLDMTTPGVEVRPIRNAIGDSHFCEIFLNDVRIPAANLVGAENSGWQVAQATLGAERGMTMLELAERLGNAGFRWLVQMLSDRRPGCRRPAGAVRNRDHRPARAVPPARGERRGGHRGAGRRVHRQAVLQRTPAAHDRLRCRDRRPARRTPNSSSRHPVAGNPVRGCWISSAPGSGRFPADRARSSGRSSPSAVSGCRESRAWPDGSRIRGVPRRAPIGCGGPARQGPRGRLAGARRRGLGRTGGTRRSRRGGRDVRRGRRDLRGDGPRRQRQQLSGQRSAGCQHPERVAAQRHSRPAAQRCRVGRRPAGRRDRIVDFVPDADGADRCSADHRATASRSLSTPPA